jgi:hypothetical protein
MKNCEQSTYSPMLCNQPVCDSVLEVEIVAKADIPSAMEMTYIAIAVSYPARPTHARSLHGNYMYM